MCWYLSFSSSFFFAPGQNALCFCLSEGYIFSNFLLCCAKPWFVRFCFCFSLFSFMGSCFLCRWSVIIPRKGLLLIFKQRNLQKKLLLKFTKPSIDWKESLPLSSWINYPKAVVFLSILHPKRVSSLVNWLNLPILSILFDFKPKVPAVVNSWDFNERSNLSNKIYGI